VPYTNLKVPARLVYVRGPVANGTAPNAGHSYFKARFTAAGFMAEVEAMAAQIVRVADTIASQRAVTRTLVLGYSQGGHVAWLLAATGRFDVVLPVSGALAPSYQPPPPTGTTTIRAMHGEDDRTLPATAGAVTFRAFSAAGYKGDFSRVRAGHALATLGQHIAPLLTATLSPQPARPIGLAAQLRGR
jgi:predicted esterase